MAPFSRDKGQSRGGRHQPERFQQRNSGRGRGRGRGTGKSNSGTRGHRETFKSARVEEQPQDASASESDIPDGEAEEEDGPTGLSSDSEKDDLPTSTAKPYNLLLQSLTANVEGEPPSKKRKLAKEAITPKPQVHEDAVDEASEDDEAEEAVLGDVDEDGAEETSDPFTQHLTARGETELSRMIKEVKCNNWQLRKGSNHPGWSYSLKAPETLKLAPTVHSETPISLDSILLKARLKQTGNSVLGGLDPSLSHLTSSIFNYRDALFPQRTIENASALREISCLHMLNHVFKTRDRVIKNNERLAKADDDAELEFRDQGFTRPKVLVILPTRQSCVRYVDTIISLCLPEQQENRKRFQDGFASGEDDFSNDKPKDFQELFAGNDDDMFRLGMKFTRKTVKFFSKFYNSDVIFASPLGLRMALGADDPKKQDHDFLSSIEIVVIDQADAILMQNWGHIEYIFEHLNLQPKEAHGCDFSRVREWYLDGNAKYLRQSIVFTAFNFPSLNKVYTQHMLNLSGKAKYSKAEDGAMLDLGISPKQTFSRLEYANPVSEPDDRFKYFSTAVLPSLTKRSKRSVGSGTGILIFLPLYADFVRVRNYLATSSESQDISFGNISEYSSVKDVARARSHFLSGRHAMLLYTERAHHFRRYHLKGVKKVVMYGLPENPIFYKEIAGGFLGASIAAVKLDEREASVRALFSRLDLLKLERIVGSTRHVAMLKEKGGDTFDFV